MLRETYGLPLSLFILLSLLLSVTEPHLKFINSELIWNSIIGFSFVLLQQRLASPNFFSWTFSSNPIPLWQHMMRKKIYAIYSSPIIFAATSLLFFQERISRSVFWLRSVLKQFEIISDTHEEYFGNTTQYNILEICIRVKRPLKISLLYIELFCFCMLVKKDFANFTGI